MRQVLSGMVAAGALAVALHFLAFYRRSSDRLFAFFAVAFALMGVNHVALGLTDQNHDARVLMYGVRLIAFLLILVAIWDKNRGPRGNS